MDLVIQNLSKTYPDFHIELSISVRRGELLSLLGPSGCGKTTTLRLIAGLIEKDRGSILLGGRQIEALPPEKREIGIVFQDYALFPHMNVYNNIAFGLQMRGVSGRKIEARVKELLELVHLQGYEKRHVTRLSGGEQQRVALSRALAPNPKLLLLDEPLSALDAGMRKSLRGEIRRIQRELNVTTVYVTHDQEEALVLSDRIAVMHNGRIEQEGTAREIYEHPGNLFVAGFVGDSNILAGEILSVEGNYTRIETPLGIFKALVPKSKNASPDTPPRATLFFRPEACRINGNEGNCIEGKVDRWEYLGDSITITLNASGIPITIKQNKSVHLTHGQEMRICVGADDCILLLDL
jgi:ABC-type Fe3+/spermidine/putrescine transport system ATPase subunit